MKRIQTLDEALLELEQKSAKKVSLPKEDKPKVKASKPELVKKEVNRIKTTLSNTSKIMADAKSVLNYYVNKIPDVKILDKQISILKNELIIYTKNKSVDNIEKTKKMLDTLVERRNKIDKVFNRRGSTNKDAQKREETLLKIKNSPELKELRERQKEIEKSLKENTPSTLMEKFKRYKKQMQLIENIDSDKVISIDDYAKLDDSYETYGDLEQEYYDYCGYLGQKIGKSASEVNNMKEGEILVALRTAIGSNQDIKDELTSIKMEIAHEKAKITDEVSVTEIIYNIFDFKNDDTDGKIPKDILAASHMGLVNAISYKVASGLNSINKLDDAVCGGLLGLTVAINSWYKLQRMKDSPLSFQDFANQYIANYAKRALYELSPSLMTGSSLATFHTREKQKLEDFLRFNPQFKDMDHDLVMSLIDAGDEKKKDIGNTMVESDYNAIVGGEDGDVDMWSLSDYNSSGYDVEEAKENYSALLKSIGSLMNMFEHKPNKVTGELQATDKKLFNMYDRKIFLMNFGIDYKKERDDDGKSKTRDVYTQAEMCVEIEAMYAAHGERKTMSQPALNYRIEQIMKKIKAAMEFNPKIKMAFEYLFNYWIVNREALNDMSNYREEIGMSIDREELREIHAGDEQQLNRQLTDGKRLSDIFEISDTNPLDDEISNLFNEL